ncbi:MAG: DUF2075 domain-containing protein [Blastocatellales bacterium]|nr:DUF2075 domain-containing protein [Blastocatellales bacterium]
MSHGFAGHVAEFRSLEEDALIGRLINGVAATGVDGHRNAQIAAWREQFRILRRQLAGAPFQAWFIVLEYEIPRRSRRPDAVLLHGSTVFVVEFKVGAETHDATSRWQVQSYGMDLRDFHAGSHGRVIVPVLCATRAEHRGVEEGYPVVIETGITDVVRATGDDLAERLLAVSECVRRNDEPIEPENWLASPYRPTPTIIEAAVRLYEGHGVRELSHRHAHNLDLTTEMLVEEIERARRQRRRVVCFVTGIPGAGKTLTGLDVVHDPELRGDSVAAGIFLSGNRPLVKVVREALVMHQTAKGRRRQDCVHEVSTFIQNVHEFLRYQRENPGALPHEHIVVFDEAQRAWDQAQMSRKHDVAASEAAELLDVMERLPDWAVVIALVGGGQEIYLGEAGLEEWGRALTDRLDRWHVVASPQVLGGGESVAGHRLFDGPIPPALRFHEEPLAHLAVGVRSHRAQRWAEWVNEFLNLRLDAARALVPDPHEFPCIVTRDLNDARDWLRMMRAAEPEHRTGLVATSEDQRLRAYSLERSSAFRIGYPFDKWFLAPPDDIRSSFALEVAASEFECQGLELDWVGMCWGGDLTPHEDSLGWEYLKFRGAGWQNVHQDIERAYVRNRYRVLLTRARRGMVIWVPIGSEDDPTRDPKRFDRVHAALLAAGLPALEEVFPQ